MAQLPDTYLTGSYLAKLISKKEWEVPPGDIDFIVCNQASVDKLHELLLIQKPDTISVTISPAKLVTTIAPDEGYKVQFISSVTAELLDGSATPSTLLAYYLNSYDTDYTMAAFDMKSGEIFGNSRFVTALARGDVAFISRDITSARARISAQRGYNTVALNDDLGTLFAHMGSRDQTNRYENVREPNEPTSTSKDKNCNELGHEVSVTSVSLPTINYHSLYRIYKCKECGTLCFGDPKSPLDLAVELRLCDDHYKKSKYYIKTIKVQPRKSDTKPTEISFMTSMYHKNKFVLETEQEAITFATMLTDKFHCTAYESVSSNNAIKRVFGDIEYYLPLGDEITKETLKKSVIQKVKSFAERLKVDYWIYDSSGPTTHGVDEQYKKTENNNKPSQTFEEIPDKVDDDHEDDELGGSRNEQPKMKSKSTKRHITQPTSYKLSLHVYFDVKCRSFGGIESIIKLALATPENPIRYDSSIYQTNPRLFRVPNAPHEREKTRILRLVESSTKSYPLIQTTQLPQTKIDVEKFVAQLKQFTSGEVSFETLKQAIDAIIEM